MKREALRFICDFETDTEASTPSEKIQFCIKLFEPGLLLVARSRFGICATVFGNSSDQLKRDLQNLFPEAELEEGDIDLKKLGQRVARFIKSPQGAPEFPIDPRTRIVSGIAGTS